MKKEKNLKFRVRDLVEDKWESTNTLECVNDELRCIYHFDCPERYVIQQETGLLDVFGNPIFEGDIVAMLGDFVSSFEGHFENEWTVRKVLDREGFRFVLTDTKDEQQHSGWNFDALEVIGNAFEGITKK